MKKLLLALLIYLVFCLFIFILCAFIHFDLNPENWESGARYFVSVFWFLGAFILGAYTVIEK